MDDGYTFMSKEALARRAVFVCLALVGVAWFAGEVVARFPHRYCP